MGRKDPFETIGAIDTRTDAILQALWSFEQNNTEATYNKLYQVAYKIERMPRQTFQKRLNELIKSGLVSKRIKQESKLNYKPRVYKLTEKGRTVLSLNQPFIKLMRELAKKAESIPLPELFSFFINKLSLAVFSSPLFVFLGHGGFLSYYTFALMDFWREVIKKRAEEKPEEFLEVLAQALALTVVTAGEPLPKTTIEMIKTHLKQNGVDPEKFLRLAEEYKDASVIALIGFKKEIKS